MLDKIIKNPDKQSEFAVNCFPVKDPPEGPVYTLCEMTAVSYVITML